MFQATCLIHICNDVTVKHFRRLLLYHSGVFFRLLQVNYLQEAGTKIPQ